MAKKADALTAQVRARLTQLLAASGLTQVGLGERAGIRQSELSRFFTGQMKFPPLTFLDRLARVFQRTLADLIREEMAPLPPGALAGPDEAELLACYRTLPSDSRRVLRDLANQWAHDATAAPLPAAPAATTPDDTAKAGGRRTASGTRRGKA